MKRKDSLCTLCGETNEREFYPRQKAKCKRCVRDLQLRKAYGITSQEYEHILALQGGVCKVCAGLTKTGKRLFVDHDHRTGKVRALLCDVCNTTLWNHTIDSLQGVLRYLERFEKQRQPKNKEK